ncbi:HNH endonuclease signature motif containing protein [Geodermatophilus sp. SYSU D00815]
MRKPDGGSLTLAITDENGELLGTLSHADLARAVERGEGPDPPAATGRCTPTPEHREFVSTPDRTCRAPFCGRRAAWADHDHVVPHPCGGQTSCTNLCCLRRTHHRLKTLFQGWLSVMEPDGTLPVTTPSGITRTTEP